MTKVWIFDDLRPDAIVSKNAVFKVTSRKEADKFGS